MRKSQEWGFHQRDILFLKDIGAMESKVVAQKHKLKNTKVVSNHLQRIQLRITRCRNYTNAITALQRENSRIRKKTTSSKIPIKLQEKGFVEEAKIRDEEEIEERGVTG